MTAETGKWARVEQLYYGALELAASERAAFLDRACAGEEALRREVESLLAAHEQAESFLSEPADEAAALMLATIRVEPPATIAALSDLFTGVFASIAPGQFIGHYRIIRELGRGGMGSVYLAERADDQYHQRVAIKLLRRGSYGDSVARRFRTERQILALLDHPHIARLLDGGVTEAGDPYFVMEYIEGAPLDEYCDEHRLSMVERLKLFRDICSAVQYAHQNLIIHRDLKPGNILVTKDGAVKLLDFGIAKLLESEGFIETIEETATGLRLMTPQYASPEQARGEVLTTASDVYSLGVILYELLAGHRPYRLDSRRPHEMVRVICEEEPLRPSAAVTREEEITTTGGARRITPESVGAARGEPPEKLRRRLADELDNIVLMALRKEPQRRYASVEQFAEDIRRHLEGLPVGARKDTFGYRAGKFVKRHRAGVAAATLIVLSLLGGIVATVWQARIARAEQRKAETERARTEAQRQRAEFALTRAESERLRAENALAEADAQRLSAENERRRQEEQRRRAVVAQANAEAQRTRAESALAQAEAQRARAEQRFNDVRKLANNLVFDLQGRIEGLPGSTEVRLNLLKTAAEYLDNLAKDAGDNPSLQRELAGAYDRLGEIQGASDSANSGDLKAGLQSSQKSLAIRKALAAANPSNTIAQQEMALSYSHVGYLLSLAGDTKGALDHTREAIRVLDPLVSANAADRASRNFLKNSYFSLGTILVSSGDLAGGLEAHHKSLAVNAELYAADPANRVHRGNLALSHKRVGAILGQQGDVDKALEHYRQAQQLDEAAVAADPKNLEARLDLSFSLSDTAFFLRKKGDLTGAREGYRKVVAIRESVAAADPKNARARGSLASAYGRLGTVLSDSGDLTGALEHCRKTLTIYEEMSAVNPGAMSERANVARARQNLGYVYAKLATDEKTPAAERLEHWRTARSWYQQCLDIWLDLRGRGRLQGIDAGNPDLVAKEIARCDAEIEKLKGR